jgi:phosphohistidine phosphatase
VTLRRLALLRHAKAEEQAADDASRPLAPRGRSDARAVGEWLAAHDLVPDHVVVSPALRARQTWQAAADVLADPPEPAIDRRVYLNSVAELLDVIHDVPASSTTVAVIGHNPSMHALAFSLDDGTGDTEARQWVSQNFPPGALAVFEVETDWTHTDSGSGRLIAATAPRAD